jgi:multicomponent Na+:H+ antiporter subunit B
VISIILRTAARYLIPLLFLFSIFVLFRGHNLPGGGFAGGLLAATGFALYVFSEDAKEAGRAIKIDPHLLVGIGLLAALGSGIPGLAQGKSFMTSLWGHLGDEAIGTPLLFDVGVYLVVLGSALMIILTLGEE